MNDRLGDVRGSIGGREAQPIMRIYRDPGIGHSERRWASVDVYYRTGDETGKLELEEEKEN